MLKKFFITTLILCGIAGFFGRKASALEKEVIDLNPFSIRQSISIGNLLPPSNSNVAFLDYKYYPPKPVNNSKEQDNGFIGEIGGEVYSYNYQEPEMEENGTMIGVNASLRYKKGILFGANLRFASGLVTYNGGIQGTDRSGKRFVIPYSHGGIRNLGGEVRGLLGLDFFGVSPYLGIGTRWWKDDLSELKYEGTPVGYTRDSSYIYSPIGISFLFGEEEKKLSLQLTGEYDVLWRGKQESGLSELPYFSQDATHLQEDGYGVRGSARFIFRGFIIEPFFRTWTIEQSNIVTINASINGNKIPLQTLEPANATAELGIKIGGTF